MAGLVEAEVFCVRSGDLGCNFGSSTVGPCSASVRRGVAPAADAQGRCDGVGSEEIGSKPFGQPTWPEGFPSLCLLDLAIYSPHFFGEAPEWRPWA